MLRVFRRLLKDDSGATAVEYGLIGTLISLAIVAGASLAGNSIGNTFSNIATAVGI